MKTVTWILGVLGLVLLASVALGQPPPRLLIYHFDVNVGDSTLLVSPDGHGVLIDAGNTGRGRNPIVNTLNTLQANGILQSLDYTIVSHYDSDHIGGMDEVYRAGWYPAIAAHDRGNSNLRPFVEVKLDTCEHLGTMTATENLAPWGTAQFCPQSSRYVTCAIAQYITAAEAGGRRDTLDAGDVITLDNGLVLRTVVANGQDIDGDEPAGGVYFSGRRGDCGENDFSIGILVEFGDFRYFLGGDLTGEPDEDVADVEGLLIDDVQDVDVYKISHHGANTSSSLDFMQAVMPTVAVASNGSLYCHPAEGAMENVLAVSPPPFVYSTNQNPNMCGWQNQAEGVADANFNGFDGLVEMQVWRRSYRVWRWRNGQRIDNPGRRFLIKPR